MSLDTSAESNLNTLLDRQSHFEERAPDPVLTSVSSFSLFFRRRYRSRLVPAVATFALAWYLGRVKYLGFHGPGTLVLESGLWVHSANVALTRCMFGLDARQLPISEIVSMSRRKGDCIWSGWGWEWRLGSYTLLMLIGGSGLDRWVGTNNEGSKTLLRTGVTGLKVFSSLRVGHETMRRP